MNAGSAGPHRAVKSGLPREPVATTPPEARGLARDEVRLLVAGPGGAIHTRFRALPRFIRPGDLLVVNTSATLPAAVDARRDDGAPVTVHASTSLDDGSWLVEVRPPGHATGPLPDARRGERLALPGGARLTLEAAYPDQAAERSRLWRARISGAAGLRGILARHGRPIAYAYVRGRWPLAAYQAVFARHPGSAEMPSAGRPFSRRLVRSLLARGVGIAPVVLHTGVSSGEGPLPEPFRVPRGTARRIEAVHAAGGRVIAVGTTVTRALETLAAEDGTVRHGGGWTDLVLGPRRPARAVDGIVTGWHPAGASHLELLAAVAGRRLVRRAYRAARAARYLWHEFGDSALFLRATSGA